MKDRVGAEPAPGERDAAPRSPPRSREPRFSPPHLGVRRPRGRGARSWRPGVARQPALPVLGPRPDGQFPGRRRDSSSLESLLSVDTVLFDSLRSVSASVLQMQPHPAWEVANL